MRQNEIRPEDMIHVELDRWGQPQIGDLARVNPDQIRMIVATEPNELRDLYMIVGDEGDPTTHYQVDIAHRLTLEQCEAYARHVLLPQDEYDLEPEINEHPLFVGGRTHGLGTIVYVGNGPVGTVDKA